MREPEQEIAARLVELHGLPPDRACAAVREVLDGLAFTVDEYISSRHEELQRAGLSNPTIYSRIRCELAQLRFRAPTLSDRQIRRRIYG